MKRPQFKLRDLLVATLMVAAGFGCLQWFFLGEESLSIFRVVALPFGFPLLFAGIMWPFRRARLGAYVGFIGQIIVLFATIVVVEGWKYARRQLLDDPWSQVIVGLTAFVIALALFAIVRRLLRFLRRSSVRTE